MPTDDRMPFESVSYRCKFRIEDFPARWLPLFSLYDPDLPLFPISYFHILTPDSPQRPSYSDRIYGYIERMNLESNGLDVFVICNKNLDSHHDYLPLVEGKVRDMLGLTNPVTLTDVDGAFTGSLSGSNRVLVELWHRVVGTAYGNKLPFGPMWDPVFGLARFVASWYSPSGRKGELIQTHYFVSRFGERIQAAGEIPQNDFFLLPTFQEITDASNPLTIFPKFSKLLSGTKAFVSRNTRQVQVGRLRLSAFTGRGTGVLNGRRIESLAASLSDPERIALIEAFNAFDKGPQRTVIFLLMLGDPSERRLNPPALTPGDVGHLYDDMGRSYQSPKVMALYSQQCFGNVSCIPIDDWVETFFRYPLSVYPQTGSAVSTILSDSHNLGKVERLLWIAAQARKVHSSACDDAIWCTKYNSEKKPRGANPLACKICILRSSCPAFDLISRSPVVFNGVRPRNGFLITTTDRDNTTPRQRFVTASGGGKYGNVVDDFSPVDDPDGYREFPAHDVHRPINVSEFVERY